MLRVELITTLKSKRFLYSALLGTVILMISIGKDLGKEIQSGVPFSGNLHSTLFSNATCSELASSGMVVVCSLPFAASCIEDIKSKYILFRISRGTIKQYILSKLCAAYLIGGLLAMFSFIIFYVELLLFVAPLEFISEQGLIPVEMLVSNLRSAMMYDLTVSFFSLVAMVLGTLFMNHYIAYAASFIVYYLLVILHDRYIRGYSILDPREWILHFDTYPFGIVGIGICTIALSVLLGSVFYLFMDRRLKVG